MHTHTHTHKSASQSNEKNIFKQQYNFMNLEQKAMISTIIAIWKKEKNSLILWYSTYCVKRKVCNEILQYMYKFGKYCWQSKHYTDCCNVTEIF